MTMRLTLVTLMLSTLLFAVDGCTDVKIINVLPTAGPTNTPGAITPPRPSPTEPFRSPTPTTAPVEPTATPTGPTPTMGAETATPTPTPTTVVGPPIGEFTCTLDPATSVITIHLTNNRMISVFDISGTIVTECGGIDPDSGDATCVAKNLALDPVNVLGVGFICATYVPDCPGGQIVCNGGPSLDTDLLQDHNIGSCDGNPSCATACQTYCADLDPPRTVFDSGCDGYCEGGTNDGNTCTQDSDCPGGACNGPDPVNVPNICGCQCLLIGGTANPSRPGGMVTNFGVQLNVEATLPCGDGDTTIALPPVCIPLATEQATGLVINANNRPGLQIGPITVTGEPATCEQLMTGDAAGMSVVSNVSFFGSALGDLEAEVDFSCK